MKQSFAISLGLAVAFALSAPAFAKGGSGGRTSYGGGAHSSSHGGTYKGGSGSSHKGGKYTAPNGGRQYGTHK